MRGWRSAVTLIFDILLGKLKTKPVLIGFGFFYLVEVRGIEPLSKEVSSRGTTSVVNG